MSRSATPAQFHQKSKTLNDKYLLGDEIGKGAYRRVYMGLDSENGDFVAIKEVSLENIFPEDLASIMQEIDLLKILNHKNIVKYLGSFKTKSHLYIILEYVENGSLASIIKPNKFGAFPESLVAVYIAQVLEGLVYLHEQGVIHRDIKGANILITKEGLVKLADFGVATKLTESDANTYSVVGTPYWMAPEVIVMSGVSAASDIWSMGCTVIELLTCVPPYYDLQPMTALFRIVEDERPPIPEDISPLLTDFLHQCFQKDAKLRPDAKTLLRHPWILNSRRSSYSSVARHEGRLKNVFDDTADDRLKLVEEADTNASRRAADETRGNGSCSSFDDNAISFRHAKEIEMRVLIASSSPPLLSHQLAGQAGDGKSFPDKVIGSEESFGKHNTENGVSLRSSMSLIPEEEITISTKDTTAANEERAELQLAGKTSAVPLTQVLSKFSDTLADCTLVDLFDVTSGRMPASRTDEGLRSNVVKSNSVLSSSNSVSGDIGRMSLARELKEKIVQTKVAGEVATSAKRSKTNPFPTLMSSDEVINCGIPDLVTLRTQSVELNRLIGLLKPEESEDSIIKACQKLVSIFKEQPDQKPQIIVQHGVMPFMEMFEVKNTRVLHAVMQVVNQLAKDDSRFQENACLAGLIPIVMSFAGPEHSKEMRLQAASFVQQLCQTSSSSLQMFIACRGLPVLVGFLEPDYGKYREMVHIAIDGMWQVLRLHTATPKNDFCRIFSKNGVLIRLVNTLHSLNEATRLCIAVKISSSSTADNVSHRSRSGPIEPSRALSGHIEAFHPRSGQLDASRVRAGQRRNMDSFQPLSGTSSNSHVVEVEVEHHPNHVELANPFPNLFEHVTTDGGWSSSGQQEQPLLFRVDRENFDLGPLESSPLEMDQKGPLLGTNVYTKDNMDQSWYSVDLVHHANGHVESSQHQQEQVQSLISLLEKDPSSRPVSGQLEYIRHLQGGLDRHESIVPLLHHASTIRKANGELDLMSPFDENGKSNGLFAQEQLKTSTKLPTSFSTRSVAQAAVGSTTAGENSGSSMGMISQPASGLLTVSGVLNGKPVSETSSGVLSRMVSNLNADAAREYLEKVAELLLEFSRGDTVVKSHMCSLSLLIRLFQMLNKLEPPILLRILECIRELSADPYTLEHLQRADAMKHLVPFLERHEGPLVSQIQNEVMVALYNLCKINKRRQERAAESGIIPHLMHFIKIKSQLKQFALPLLCDMAHASRYTREQLRANKGIELYLSLLDDEDWVVTALDSLAVCLALDNDQRKVEQTLLRAEAIHKLVAFFQYCSEQTFLHILEPFLKIIIKSPRINVSLATSGLVPLLVERLEHQDAIARLNLLKLMKAVYEHHPRPKQLIVEYDLQQKLQRLIEDRRGGDHSGGQVLVKQMATSLLKALHINCVL